MITIYLVMLVLLTDARTQSFAETSFISPSITGQDYLIDSKFSTSHMPALEIKVNEKGINDSISISRKIVDSMKRFEINLGLSNIKMKPGTPSHGMFISFFPEREAIERGKDALIAVGASLQLIYNFCDRYNFTDRICAKYLHIFKFRRTLLETSCKQLQTHCSQEEQLSAYRSLDGSCNHISTGYKGQSFTGYTRLLYPDYLDGIHEPRRSVNKKPLPNPRKVSMSIVEYNDNLDDYLTLAVLQWGQFLEHDISRPAISVMVHTGNPIECCTPEGNNLSPRYIHPFCSSIPVSTDDNYFSNKDLHCMNYVRSMPAIRSDCSFGPSDQVNQATHFLDGSQIYGSTYQKSLYLRLLVDGNLKMSVFNERKFLPISQNPMNDCQVNYLNSSCYKSGDSRVNFQPQLTVMHTIWFREHNRIAKELAKLNSQWDDETIFQETRKIVIAEMQHITYNEWVNTILSKKYTSVIETINEYNENVDPSVSNSFATAAIASLKSLYDGKVKLFNENRRVNTSFNLHKYFNNPDIIHKPGCFDALIRGIATQSVQKLDRNYAKDLINKLYNNGRFGFDVLSMDIHRGRDHGLPGYSEYRTLCGFKKAETFYDFSDVMSEVHIQLLSETYSNFKDVDLIVGGLLENAEDSIFGPTFSCIIADQLIRTKKGDRYFYTNENQPKPFTLSQLNEIKKVTLSRILCDNGDNISEMQPNAFEKISMRMVDELALAIGTIAGVEEAAAAVQQDAETVGAVEPVETAAHLQQPGTSGKRKMWEDNNDDFQSPSSGKITYR